MVGAGGIYRVWMWMWIWIWIWIRIHILGRSPLLKKWTATRGDIVDPKANREQRYPVVDAQHGIKTYRGSWEVFIRYGHGTRYYNSAGSRVGSAVDRAASVHEQVGHHRGHEDHSKTGVRPR